MFNFDKIDGWDEAFRQKIHRYRFGNRTNQGLKLLTRLGDGYIWVVILAFLVITLPMSLWAPIVYHSFSAGMISLVVYLLVKNLIRRPRPFRQISEIEAEVPPLDHFSFPSGHVMNNLAVGLILMLHLPWLGLITVILPLFCGFLRIYYGVHYLTDILAGMVLGALCFGLTRMMIPYLPWFSSFV